LDSAAEDCTTGIELSTDEGTGNLFIADLKQVTFTTGTPNTWSASSQFENFPEFDPFDAGTSGIAVAPGSHFVVVIGGFRRRVGGRDPTPTYVGKRNTRGDRLGCVQCTEGSERLGME
jgi:hypothetical protein